MMPEYEKYSIDELYDVYENIDSNLHPERFEIVSRLLEKGNENVAESEIIDFSNASFKSINTRLAIDNAIFTFGTILLDGESLFGYRLYCVGEGMKTFECFMPLNGKGLVAFIDALKSLSSNGFKSTLKIQTTEWADVKFEFGGSSEKKGIKVKTELLSSLSYNSSGFFISHIKQSKLNRLIVNLELCL